MTRESKPIEAYRPLSKRNSEEPYTTDSEDIPSNIQLFLTETETAAKQTADGTRSSVASAYDNTCEALNIRQSGPYTTLRRDIAAV